MSVGPGEIEEVVQRVVRQFKPAEPDVPAPAPPAKEGVFASSEEAVEAARAAFEALQSVPGQARARLIAAMREEGERIARPMAVMAREETKMGRVESKVTKNALAAQLSLGMEYLDRWSEALHGDRGLTLIEPVPFGVIAAITPSTNPTSTVISNSIVMVSAGNAVVFCPHPHAERCTSATMAALNRAIVSAGGPCNLLTCVFPSTIRATTEIMHHPQVDAICATGGPGVVQAALKVGKKTWAAGPGNPPVVVDETADIPLAARHIVEGASFDNDLMCVSEKQIMVVEEVADALIREMCSRGAHLVSPSEESRVTRTCAPDGKLNRALIGQDAPVILRECGVSAAPDTRLALMETDLSNPLVVHEQLMPVVPVIRTRDFVSAVRGAQESEQGFRHTAVVHTRDEARIAYFVRTMGCTITVANAPSYAWAGHEGEGWVSMTVAGPTGEGVATPLTFSRRRHLSLGTLTR